MSLKGSESSLDSVELIAMSTKRLQTASSEDDYDEEEPYSAHDEDITLLPTRRSTSYSPSKSSSFSPPSSRSRISRASSSRSNTMTRFNDYVAEILDANDMLPDGDGHYSSSAQLSDKVLGHFCLRDGRAVLRVEVYGKLISLLRSCGTAQARSAHSSLSSSALSSDDFAALPAVDIDDMDGLLKILHRCMRSAQHLDPFLDSCKKRKVAPSVSSPAKRSRPLTPLDQNINLMRNEEQSKSDKADYVEPIGVIETASMKMASLAYACTATHCTLSLLGSESLPKELCTDDAILPCLQVMRSALLNAILPFVRACAGELTSAPAALNELVEALEATSTHRTQKGKKTAESKGVRLSLDVEQCCHHLGKSYETLQHLFAQLSTILGRGVWQPTDSSVSLLASTLMQVSTCPDERKANSFWTFSLTKEGSDDREADQTSLACFRVPALHVVQGLYLRCNADQQAFINQTILDYVNSPNGRSQAKGKAITVAKGKQIDSVTALMLQLIQGSTKEVKLTMLESADALPTLSQQSTRSESDKTANVDVAALRHLMDEPRSVAGQFAEGLFAKLKGCKTSDSASSAAAVEAIVSDLSSILIQPQWPGASLLLSCLSRLLCSALDDRSSSADVRGMALDLLGLITARMCESLARMRTLTVTEAEVDGEFACKLENVQDARDATSVLMLEEAYGKLIQHIDDVIESTVANRSLAARYLHAQWAVELASIYTRLSERRDAAQVAAGDEETADLQSLSVAIMALDSAVERLENQRKAKSIEPKYRQKSEKGQSDSFQLLYEAVLHSFSYMVPCENIFVKLIDASAGPVASHRGKAIRALSAISEADDNFLLRFDVRSAVQRCLLDESINVRDGAVALLGRFVLAKPRYIEPLFNSLKAKIDDTGLMVRKRCLRLLADIYKVTTSAAIRAEALCEIVRSTHDPEQSMQDLALQFSAQIILSRESSTKAPHTSVDDLNDVTVMVDPSLDKQIAAMAVIVDQSTASKIPLEDVFVRLLQKDQVQTDFSQHLAMIANVLVDRIVSSTCERDDSDALRMIKLLNTIVRCLPSTFTVTLAKRMLPCIRTYECPSEMQYLGNVLDTFNLSLPSMGKTALAFAQRLQDNLRPLISQPSPHLAFLPELVRCYALVVENHTGDYAILIKMLQQCHQLLCGVVSRARSRKHAVVADRNDVVVIRLVALLVDHIDFDKVRLTNDEVAAEINAITRRSIREEALTLLLRLVNNGSFLPHALYGMRFLFRSSPQLMLQDEVRTHLTRMLNGHGMLQEKSIIIKAIADILNVEEEQRKRKKISIDHDELAGTHETLADPISFEIVQLFLAEILALIVEPSLQASILDILQHIIMRGMCHPMECLPSLVALETCVDSPLVCDRARLLHGHLIAKVGSNISFRYGVCARAAWNMHARIKGDAVSVRGYRNACKSCLQPWYDTVVESQARSSRFELLRALCKAFEVQMDVQGAELNDDDVLYARFVAEALSTLDMRTIDEVQAVIGQLDAVLDTAGEHVRIFAMEEVEVDGEEEQDEEELEEEEIDRVVNVGRMACVLVFAVYLKQHLNEQYNIPTTTMTTNVGRGSTSSAVVLNKASNKAITRKQSCTPISWHGIPGHGQAGRKTAYQRAKAVMGFFDDIMTE